MPAIAAMLLWLSFVLSTGSASAQDRGYLVNPGDVLAISVWREPELQRETVVLPDGTISFPLAGQVPAAGRYPGDIERDLENRLARFIESPVASVSVVNPAGNKIYVLGEVVRPGEFAVLRPTTVMQALSLAGGLTPFASRNKIVVIRNDAGGQYTFPFRYGDVEGGDALQMNIELKSGDTVVVPSTSLF